MLTWQHASENRRGNPRIPGRRHFPVLLSLRGTPNRHARSRLVKSRDKARRVPITQFEVVDRRSMRLCVHRLLSYLEIRERLPADAEIVALARPLNAVMPVVLLTPRAGRVTLSSPSTSRSP
ncbi:hypothetical protein KMZ68_11775 [Bradyrhizobium sediminis]|uniref:Uncharacterized protein n=1 Tax=Bradyrhizobium sediminis TaxID=2840469 RepID=A0A975NSY5_9BRAD|nr:hypothetical protein [Bradyrhizobium sediminis]QWG20455.1 hypothetical protein KMZ68_11775 [Bradyrhizobium sediminis]